MVTTQPVAQEQEPLLSERQERTPLPERRSLEDMAPKLERHSSAFSEHRLAHKPEHTPPEHNTKVLSEHRLEHRLEHKAPEQHSLVSRYSNWQPELHTMASSSTDQASAY